MDADSQIVSGASGKGPETMRCRRRVAARIRKRWHLRFVFFVVYILMQYVMAATLPSTDMDVTEVNTDQTMDMNIEVSATIKAEVEGYPPKTINIVEDINAKDLQKNKSLLDVLNSEMKQEIKENPPKSGQVYSVKEGSSSISFSVKDENEKESEGQKEKEKGTEKEKEKEKETKEEKVTPTEKEKEEEKGKEKEEKKEKEKEEKKEKEKSKEGDKSKEKGKEKSKNGRVVSSTAPTPVRTTTIGYDHPTWRPRRQNCSPPAIEQFPRPLMGPSARKHGGLIIHILVAIYTFLGLAIVCDDYFVSSLDRICEELRLSPDVAGATFMAAGSSAPELATVVIGVFFAKDDIGVSGVIGSAVFNIMFVISVCGLCTTTVSKLNWWPLCRDCFFYAISILVMLFTIYNESISWMESLFMLIMYGVYCVALSFNARLERWAKSYNIPFLPKDDEPAEESALVSYRSLQEDRLSYTGPNSPSMDQFKTQEGNGMQDMNEGQMARTPQSTQQIQQPQPQPQYYKAKEPDPNEVSPLVKPTDGNKWTLFTWGLVYPIHFLCRATMPDCRQEKFRSWYPFTFCISMIWISFYSYIMVWMITIIGSTLGIPDTVMGLTFVAAGVSVPDALSSLAVIKEGLGDMAVSNAVGSNVFDILVCLGLPWFIQTAMIQPGSHVNVTSRGLTYSTVSLLSTVIFLVVATHLNGWKLDRRYGVILMVWYLIFIVFASLYELNVFGQMNPPVCFSEF